MVFNVGAILQIVASEKTGLGIMYAGRAIVGWGVGVASNLTVSFRTAESPHKSLISLLLSPSTSLRSVLLRSVGD